MVKIINMNYLKYYMIFLYCNLHSYLNFIKMLMFTINTLRKNHVIDPFLIPRFIVPETNMKIYLVRIMYCDNVIYYVNNLE